MAYVTYQEMVLRYPALKNLGDNIQTTVCSDLLHYAEVELNARLGAAFTTPFSDAHPTVKDLTMDLAYARNLRIKDPKKGDALYKSVSARIDRILTGKEYIATNSGTVLAATSPSQEIWSTTMGYHPVHSMLGTENPYTSIDSSMIEDEENERS